MDVACHYCFVFADRFFLWQFNVDMRQAERERNRDKMMDMADKAKLAGREQTDRGDQHFGNGSRTPDARGSV